MGFDAAICHDQRVGTRKPFDVVGANAAALDRRDAPVTVRRVPDADHAAGPVVVILGREENGTVGGEGPVAVEMMFGW